MVTLSGKPDEMLAQPAARGSLEVDAWIGKRAYRTISRFPIRGPCGETLAEAANVPRLALRKMFHLARMIHAGLQEIDDWNWYGIFRRAAECLLTCGVPGIPYAPAELAQLAARTTGLPAIRILRAWQSLGQALHSADEIAAAQSPDGTTAPYRTGSGGRNWAWTPAGRNVAVRIPPNFPTININWIQALAVRRPVILLASLEDPWTPSLLVAALYEAGLPDGAVSLLFGDAPGVTEFADQVMWPGSPPTEISRLPRHRLLPYHAGRSKAIIQGQILDAAVFSRVARMVMQGCGRLCTNPSSVLVVGDAMGVAETLGDQLAEYPLLPLEDPKAAVPAFCDPARAKAITHQIRTAIGRGAVDVTAGRGHPLLIEMGGCTFVRPTVLVLPARDPLFGVELPFPFVTVSQVPRSEVVSSAAHSLLVSLIGDCPDLVTELIAEPTIGKVFWGAHFDRNYDPRDPHEGYVADFLFQKKAISNFAWSIAGGCA